MYSSAYVWAKIISYLEERLSSLNISTTFDDAEVIELNEEQLIIHSPNEFRRENIQRRYTPYIQDALKEIFNSEAKLVVFSDAELENYRAGGEDKTAMDFNPQFSFDTFVVGPSNRFAYGAATAVSKAPGQAYNPLFLYGPPGVGKTSIASSIAKAMGRPFIKISLAGISDSLFLRGTQTIFKDARPGRIVDALIRGKSFCPLILLDEIDKMGDSKEHGDPESVLLDVLDSDRSKFVDNFLGFAMDLSNVIFIATANRLEPLSPVLKDRLDIVQLPPYKPVDKKRIVEKHMWPRLIVEYKLDCLDYLVDPLQESLCHPEALRLEEDAVEEMIRRCPEEGVRNLERLCRKLCESVIGTYYATGELINSIDLPTMNRLLEPIYYK